MQSLDTARAVDLPNGAGFTTEVGDLLFSLQALLIRETEGEGADTSFASVTTAAQQPRWALDEAPARATSQAPETHQVPATHPAAEPEPVLFDPSTGAPTLDALHKEMDRHGSRISAALVTLDVKPIAEIRSQEGDAVAEAILRAIVEAVPFALRAQDQVFRTGLDELTLCVPNALLSDAAIMSLGLQMAVKDVLVRRELPPVILSIRPYHQVAA